MSYIPDLNQVRGKAEPAPSWRWVVRLPDLIPRTRTPSFPVPYQGLLRTSTIPFGMVENIEFSVRQIDSDQRFRAGARHNFPRFMSVPNVSITFFEDINYGVTRYLRSWENLIIDEEHNYGIPAIYKHPISLFAFDYVSNTAPVMVGRALGCWPTTFSGLSYNYDGSSPVTVTADFAVDEDVIQVGAGTSFSIMNGLGGAANPLNQFRQFVSNVRGVADNIRGTVNQVLQPIREVRSLVDEGLGSVRETVGAARSLINLPRTLGTELGGIVGGSARQNFGSEFRSLFR